MEQEKDRGITITKVKECGLGCVIWRLSLIICTLVTLILVIIAIPFWVITGRFLLDYRHLKRHKLVWHYKWWHKILNKKPHL